MLENFFKGILFLINSSLFFCSFGSDYFTTVLVGATVLTLIPNFFRSIAKDLVKPSKQ